MSYFNIYENIVLYLCTFITTLYHFKHFSHSLFHLHLVVYKQIFSEKKITIYSDIFDGLEKPLYNTFYLPCNWNFTANNSYFSKIALENSGNKSSALGL